MQFKKRLTEQIFLKLNALGKPLVFVTFSYIVAPLLQLDAEDDDDTAKDPGGGGDATPPDTFRGDPL